MVTNVKTAPLFTLRGVTRTFKMGEVDVPVLRGVDLDIPRAGITVLLGPSGSGKTTLLNMIGAVDRPDAGEIRVEEHQLVAMSDRELSRYRRDHVGFIFQFYNLIPTLTALENVQAATELVREPMDASEALEVVDLSNRANHFPAQLSGGEQQRVAIARALAKKPTLLLCDEPTGALDLDTGRKVLGVLRRVCSELGVTVIIVTHNSAIAEMADRVVRLGSGVIEEVIDHATPKSAEEIRW